MTLFCSLGITNVMAQEDSTEPLETIYQKFTFTLFNKVAEDGNKNVILSPLSAQIALSMVQNGAATTPSPRFRRPWALRDIPTNR